jgi:hypothetical protein
MEKTKWAATNLLFEPRVPVRQIEDQKLIKTRHLVGQFHFAFILCLYTYIISTFMYVGGIQISCEFLPTRYSSIFLLILNSYIVMNVRFQIHLWKK